MHSILFAINTMTRNVGCSVDERVKSALFNLNKLSYFKWLFKLTDLNSIFNIAG